MNKHSKINLKEVGRKAYSLPKNHQIKIQKIVSYPYENSYISGNKKVLKMSNIYKKGENKKQQMFFPPSIDEYVIQDNQVRAIEDYVEILDMVKLGFTKSALNSSDGQPAYHSKLLLKIYIYGYLNRIRSSRKLEIEIKRNIEMMWLCAGLKPSYKTISE